ARARGGAPEPQQAP
ncbi:Protein of unknown function, partial [Gryllus bimaculatus]